ncbi:unnamed protein product [Polarella glacialis]|uniref:Cytokinin riboside 5'-monophosphate phosphoribohydrolase n=1 Tax=Polarella glacialis TaxID=89957 RepID=A0A813FTG6_POLGL|nr:unnamed protein product [Polarella glacialis]
MGVLSCCVYLGSSLGTSPEFAEAADAFGSLLAKHKVRVIYGGASSGCMGRLADAALGAGGDVVGVFPGGSLPAEILHQGLTESISVASMHERKEKMYELSGMFVAMPGGIGTWEEIFEIITWKKLGRHNKPVVIMNLNGYYDPILEQCRRSEEDNFMPPRDELFRVVTAVDQMEAILKG